MSMTRRDLMKTGAALPLLAEGATMAGPAEAARAGTRPNLLVVMTDDHGQWASHAYGNSELVTPNMDFLAETGARMLNSYTPCPVCSPARACFFTGRLPSQHGMHDWIREDGDTRRWMQKERTLAAVLREGGYQTALAGKWHCGQGELAGAGFDSYFSHVTNQYPHRGVQHFQRNGKPVPFEGQQAALVTTMAQEFLRSRDRDKPFFLFVGYVDTHSPFRDHPERIVRRYRKARFSDIPDEKYVGPGRGIHLPPNTEAGRREALAQYYGAVSYVDEQLGVLLDELEGRGDLENTLVVYTADHGHMNGHHGLYTKGNATIPQNFLEESIRVPCQLRYPGKIEAGRTHSFPVDHCDLFQTLLDAAGVQEIEQQRRARNSPGQSYLLQLSGHTLKDRSTDSSGCPGGAIGRRPPSDVVHDIGRGNHEATPNGDLAAGASAAGRRSEQFCEYGNARMIRTSRHKLIVRYAPHAPRFSDELYDLAEDPRETRNLIADPVHAETVRGLRQRLDAHFAAHEVPDASGREILKRPVYNPNEPWRAPA